MQACVIVYMQTCGGRILGLGSKHFKGGKVGGVEGLFAFPKSFGFFPHSTYTKREELSS